MKQALIRFVVLPLALSLVTGLGTSGLALAWSQNEYAVRSGATVAFLFWSILIVKEVGFGWMERLTGLDLDQNGFVGPKPKEMGHFAQDKEWIPVTEDKLAGFARGVLAGKPLTEAEWVGKRKVFRAREDFLAMRDWLIERGNAAWQSVGNRRNGWAMTSAGINYFKEIIGAPHPGAW